MTISALKASDLSSPSLLWASGFGLGFLPRAPGTWGSLGALLVWWFVIADLNPLTQLVIIATYFGISWWACQRVCELFAVDDAGEVVADEVLGMWVALFALPQFWWIAILGFVTFRFLDIRKPWLIGRLDRELKGGLGIIVDDLVAGALTCLGIWALVIIFRALSINVL
ncbi:MAG: phosphatidylglycerophosphatase A [Pseudomonadales bacterium]|nr:phosphatidylglycerophosphatase A [Pseudomonadales bacterium]